MHHFRPDDARLNVPTGLGDICRYGDGSISARQGWLTVDTIPGSLAGYALVWAVSRGRITEIYGPESRLRQSASCRNSRSGC
jgi:hypothetical protein